jgi:hypothetical protein
LDGKIAPKTQKYPSLRCKEQPAIVNRIAAAAAVSPSPHTQLKEETHDPSMRNTAQSDAYAATMDDSQEPTEEYAQPENATTRKRLDSSPTAHTQLDKGKCTQLKELFNYQLVPRRNCHFSPNLQTKFSVNGDSRITLPISVNENPEWLLRFHGLGR